MKYEKNLKDNSQISLSSYISCSSSVEFISIEESLLLGKRLQANCINNYINEIIMYIEEILDEVQRALKIQMVRPKIFTSDKTDYSKPISYEMLSKDWWKF